MKKLIIWLSCIFATIAVSAAGDRFITNTNQDKDVIIQVNNGGSPTNAITINGASGNTVFNGAAGTMTYTKAANALNIVGPNNSTPLFTVDGAGAAKRIQLLKNSSEVFSVADSGVTLIGPTGFGGTHTVSGSAIFLNGDAGYTQVVGDKFVKQTPILAGKTVYNTWTDSTQVSYVLAAASGLTEKVNITLTTNKAYRALINIGCYGNGQSGSGVYSAIIAGHTANSANVQSVITNVSANSEITTNLAQTVTALTLTVSNSDATQSKECVGTIDVTYR